MLWFGVCLLLGLRDLMVCFYCLYCLLDFNFGLVGGLLGVA